MRRIVLARTAVVAAVVGGLVLPAAIAAAPAVYAVTSTATAAQVDRVRWLQQVDSRWEVRSAASGALTDPDATAIVDFLTSGRNAAVARAASNERTNVALIRRALNGAAAGSAVRRGSERALAGTHDQKNWYVKTGLAADRKLDAAGQQQEDEAAKAQAAEDRAYVAELARTDPGTQVRSAASFAANSGRDKDLAEFFSYYWAAGARLDDEAFRLRMVELDTQGHAALERLRQAALDAEAAEAAASGEAAEKLHAETVAAWSALAAAAEGTSVDWAAERDRAAEQADAWGRVAEYAAGATTEQDWSGVLARAGASKDAWDQAKENAIAQAAFWLAQAAEAQANAGGEE